MCGIAGVLATRPHCGPGAGGARVVLVGASPRALGGVPHETRLWTEAGEAAEIGSFHVGIMPLADTP